MQPAPNYLRATSPVCELPFLYSLISPFATMFRVNTARKEYTHLSVLLLLKTNSLIESLKELGLKPEIRFGDYLWIAFLAIITRNTPQLLVCFPVHAQEDLS